MFEKKLMITGLQKQSEILRELIGHLEVTPRFDADSGLFYDRMTHQVVKNLKRLRALKKNYREHWHEEMMN